MKEIPLTKGAVALVDDCDYEVLTAYSWHLTAQGYAAHRASSNPGKIGRPPRGKPHDPSPTRIVLMHRILAGATPGDGLHVHHINGSRLDNRRCNLKAIGPVKHFRHHTAKGGTYFFKQTGRWHAQASVNGTKYHLGYFDTEAEARAVAGAFQRGADTAAATPR